MTDNEKNILCKAIKKWGTSNQILMVFEECSELMNALAKINRERATKEEVITELADVSIMIDQMFLVFGEEDCNKERQRKIARLEDRINKF